MMLSLAPDRLSRLSEEKILYLLCDGPEEVETLTGFKLRGIFLMGADAIVSSFNCHRHEVAHLLLNFRLASLPLYTHPFLQEGWANAMGGRGGKARDVILHLGAFLQQSEFVTYPELLQRKTFANTDPSIAYPLSGVYNRFLLAQQGVDAYLRLYRQYSQTMPISPESGIRQGVSPTL